MRRQAASWHAARGTRHALPPFALLLLPFAFSLSSSAGEWKVPREYRRHLTGGGEADTVAFSFCDGGHAASGTPLVADETQTVLPFRVLHARRGGDTWLAYNASKAKGAVYVYYGGKTEGPPLASVPAGNWEPKLSLLLYTMKCPGGALESERPIRTAVQAGGDIYGMDFVQQIFHGANPFGPDGLFASYYVGYLRIEKPGRYRIFTASSEASFVFMDGQPLCQWPGHHDAGGGRNGQHGADKHLAKGEYKIEYFHAKTEGETCMMLGWTPPGAQGWHVIPESVWLHTPVARAEAPERRGNAPLAAFAWDQADQLLLDRKSEIRNPKSEIKSPKEAPKAEPTDVEQFTRVTFHTRCRNVPEKARVVWDYGDGAAGVGDGKEHVYVGDGPFPAVARIVAADGKVLDSYGALVAPAPALKNFTILDKDAVRRYAELIAGTDCAKVPERTMEALWELVETEEDAEKIKAFTETFANRFGVKGRAGWEAADRLALAVSIKEPERALRIYASLVPEAPSKLDAARVQLERIELVLHKLKKPEAALGLAQAIIRSRSGLEERIAAVKLGDVYRAQGDFEKAEEAYRNAQRVTYAEMDRRTIAVRQGGYLETVWSHIENGALRAARDGLVMWEVEHPIGKLSGDLILMTAKYFDRLGEPDRALAELETLVKLNPLTPYLPDVELLMARAHRKLGNAIKARELIEKVLREYPKSRAAQQATKE
ncbi:MAG: tetratricopeptide repeat protein [Planctomycetes bacterium]|nr:tetratricopeptide repeat protein [Planctomycetota bacterium]